MTKTTPDPSLAPSRPRRGRPPTGEGIGRNVRVPIALVPAVQALIAEHRRLVAQRQRAEAGFRS